MRLAPMKAIQELQLEVLTKFGTSPLQPSDCKDLSSALRERTGKIVSETTVKRFFGFAAQTFNFSVYTLNALAEFAGFQNWEFFLEHYRQQQSSPQLEFHPKWQEIKSKTGKITFYTTEAIKNNCGIDFSKAAHRADMLPLAQILHAEYPVSVCLAPAGYGKSVALAQMVEYNWLREGCVYPNDICLFISIHQLNTLLNRGFSMEDWLDNQMSLGDGENIIDYFESHAAEIDGKFILIIDGFDDKVVSNEKLKIIYSKLMDLVLSRKRTSWLKVILASRPEAWSVLSQAMTLLGPGSHQTEPTIPALEYTLEFQFPLLSTTEVKMVLKNHSFSEETLSALSDSFLKLLEFPPFLQMACAMTDSRSVSLLHEEALSCQIIGHYARSKVIKCPDYGLKMAILRKILDDTHNLRSKMPAGQARLFSGDLRIQEAYRKLLSDHVLSEDMEEGGRSLPIKRVRFFNEPLAHYFIANFCLTTHDGELNMGLFNDILSEFEDIPTQTGILRWLLLYALDREDFKSIRELFGELADLPQKAALLEFLLVQPNDQPHDNPLEQAMRDILRDEPFKNYFLRNYLFYDIPGARRNHLRKTIDYMLTEDQDKSNVACLYFLVGLYQMDNNLASNVIPAIARYAKPFNRKGTPLSAGELCLFIHKHLTEKKDDPITLEKFCQFEDYLLFSDHNILSLKDELTIYLLCYCAIMLREYKHLEKITEYVFAEIPSLKMRSHDPFRLMCLIMKSRLYLYEGDQSQYLRCLNHVEKVMASGSLVSGSDMITVYLSQVKALSHYADGEYEKSLDVLQKAQLVAKHMRFNLYDHWCYQMQASTFHALRKTKLASIAEQEAEKLRQKCSFPVLPPFDLSESTAEMFDKRAVNH
jgi:hypothetical protein